MPRIKRPFNEVTRAVSAELASRLAEELRGDREFGQPMIDEQEFPSGRLRVNVIWDDWDRMSLEDRTSLILRAYEMAESRAYRERIALANGLTVPEAIAAGMLPYHVFPALRQGDSVTAEQCRKAMIEEGASILLGEERPVLRFATEEQAEAARTRLALRLPASEPVWVVTQDVGRVEELVGV